MAKKQTRRSISVSRSTYERLKSYCETNGQSMSQFVETRVGDFLGRPSRLDRAAPQRSVPSAPQAGELLVSSPEPAPRKSAPEPAAPTADQIFTF